MKFEQTRVALEPRSAANCVDLALIFCGRHLGSLLGLWALFAVPLGLAAYLTARYTAWGWLGAGCFGFFGSAPFGVMLASGAARTTFGEEFTLRKLLADLRGDGPWIARIVGLRFPLGMAALFCFLPCVLLAVRWGFLTESRALKELHQQRHDRRTKELVALEFMDLVLRGIGIGLFGCLFWLFAELTVEAVWTILFSQSLFFGRFGDLGSDLNNEASFAQYAEHIWSLITNDPAVLTLHLMTGLAAYAVCRLAWFFCYIDLRVRLDCWDLELELLSESERLRTTGTT